MPTWSSPLAGRSQAGPRGHRDPQECGQEELESGRWNLACFPWGCQNNGEGLVVSLGQNGEAGANVPPPLFFLVVDITVPTIMQMPCKNVRLIARTQDNPC